MVAQSQSRAAARVIFHRIEQCEDYCRSEHEAAVTIQDTEYSHRNFMELYGCIIMFYVWDYGNDIEHYPSNIHEPAFLIKQHFWNQEPTPLDI